MNFKRHRQLARGELDLAPLIDVVFLLLIFFMLTSSFIFQPGIRVTLPKAVTSEVIHHKTLIVTITGENITYLDEKVVTIEELKISMEKAAKESRQLLIKADRHASLGRVVEVWDLCRELGISQINIATTQELK